MFQKKTDQNKQRNNHLCLQLKKKRANGPKINKQAPLSKFKEKNIKKTNKRPKINKQTKATTIHS